MVKKTRLLFYQTQIWNCVLISPDSIILGRLLLAFILATRTHFNICQLQEYTLFEKANYYFFILFKRGLTLSLTTTNKENPPSLSSWKGQLYPTFKPFVHSKLILNWMFNTLIFLPLFFEFSKSINCWQSWQFFLKINK